MKRRGLALAAVFLLSVLPGAAAVAVGSATQVRLCASGSASTAQVVAAQSLIARRLSQGYGLHDVRVTRAAGSCLQVSGSGLATHRSVLTAAARQGYAAIANSWNTSFDRGTRVHLSCRVAGCAPGVSPAPTNTRTRPPVLQVVIPASLIARGSAVLTEENDGMRGVVFSLLVRGGQIWCRFTSRHVERYAAFVVDNRIILDPQIQSAICGGNTQIAGLTASRAREIAVDLNYGPLPVAFQVMA